MEEAARNLVFHGAIVLIIGLMCGMPYGKAINRKASEHTVQAWRLAHLALPIGAILMIAVAAVLTPFMVSTTLKWVIAVSLIASSYAFCFSLLLAPVVGHRGLSARGPLAAKLVYLGNSAGAFFSMLAAVVLLYAGYVSL
jgi:hypothetical protein